MKNVFKLFGIIALAVVICFSMSACESDGGGDPVNPGKPNATFTSIDEFAAWLNTQRANTPATAYNIKLNVNDLGGDSYSSGSIGNLLRANENKYVRLDLSDSTFTDIGGSAFSGCASLTGVTIPDSVASIGWDAFFDCASLTAINVVTGNNAYTSENGVLYNKEKTTLMQYPKGKAGSTFIIPNIRKTARFT